MMFQGLGALGPAIGRCQAACLPLNQSGIPHRPDQSLPSYTPVLATCFYRMVGLLNHPNDLPYTRTSWWSLRGRSFTTAPPVSQHRLSRQQLDLHSLIHHSVPSCRRAIRAGAPGWEKGLNDWLAITRGIVLRNGNPGFPQCLIFIVDRYSLVIPWKTKMNNESGISRQTGHARNQAWDAWLMLDNHQLWRCNKHLPPRV